MAKIIEVDANACTNTLFRVGNLPYKDHVYEGGIPWLIF